MYSTNNHIKTVLLLLFIVVSISSCAPSEYTDKQYGFFSGIVHGFVLTFALISKLFGMGYGLYAENNTGFTYWLGFILALLLTGSRGYSSRRK